MASVDGSFHVKGKWEMMFLEIEQKTQLSQFPDLLTWCDSKLDPLWVQEMWLDCQLKDSEYMSTVLVHVMLRIFISGFVTSLHVLSAFQRNNAPGDFHISSRHVHIIQNHPNKESDHCFLTHS